MELWRSVPGWTGFYEVSSEGRVRSLPRVIEASDGPRQFSGRVLRKGLAKNGYEMVSFTAPGRKRYCAYVHDLVLAAFVGPKPDSKEACHNNGRRADNRLVNLRYDTRSANALDRRKHGTVNAPRGESAASAKLTDSAVRLIRRHADHRSLRELARQFGVHHKTIAAVVRGESWGHVNG